MSFENSLYNREGQEDALAEIAALDGEPEVSADKAGGPEVDAPTGAGVTSELEDTPEPSAQTGEEHPEDGLPAQPEHPEAGPLEPADTGYLGGKYRTREEFEGAYKAMQAEYTRNQQSLREAQDYLHHLQAQQGQAASLDQLPEEQQQALFDEAERRNMDPHTLFYLQQQQHQGVHAYQRQAALQEVQRTLSSHPMAQDQDLAQAILEDSGTVLEISALPPDRMPLRMQAYVEGQAARIRLARFERDLPTMQAAWKKQGAEEAVRRQQAKRDARGEIASGGSSTAQAAEPRPRTLEDELLTAHREASSSMPWHSGFGKR